MKNSFFLTVLYILFFIQSVLAENLNIKSKEVQIDKRNKITILEKDVIVIDSKNNIIKTNYAKYNKNSEILVSKGVTTIETSAGYFLSGKDIMFDNKKKIIKSNQSAIIKDLENNNIYLDNFEYSTVNNFFKSIGDIKVIDLKKNTYNFSQIYIDENKKEIIGTDSKAFLNDKSFKTKDENDPRIFSNSVKIKDGQINFTKSVFTLCGYRDEDKCPPWSIQASEMRHDSKSKTIFYDNAVIKVYDMPIFYLPKLSHPDPSVDRRSGFLTPSFSDSQNLGSGFTIPYFWAIDNDKDLTFTSKLFASENPLFLGGYRQAFKNSNLLLDFGYTEGYNKSNDVKKSGNKSHLFTKFVKNFNTKNSQNNFELSLQDTSNDKYLKLYKIDSDLVDYNTDVLENSLNFTHENENFFLGVNASAFETLKDTYNDKYEYIFPEVTIDKNIFNNKKYGNTYLTSNFKIHNYDSNKTEKHLINDINWKTKFKNFPNGLKGKFLGKLKNVNYEAKNISSFKEVPTNELFGAIGYLSEINLLKKSSNNTEHLLKPKALLRYAPGHMKKIEDEAKLNSLNIFTIDRLGVEDSIANGLSTTLGFDYSADFDDKKLRLSVGQVINEKENKHMPSSSSLDQRFSDVVGDSNFKVNDNLELNFDFKLDQNYKELNSNELGAKINFYAMDFKFDYLQEKEHLGNQEYVKTNIQYKKDESGLFSFESKRNLITDSSEFYNLSYEYLNDCLRAGLVFRREFYNDSEIEPDNSLMFKITLTPFGNVLSPSFKQ